MHPCACRETPQGCKIHKKRAAAFHAPLPGIDFGPHPTQLPVHFGPITNSSDAKTINSNVVIWPVISQPVLGVT